MGSVNQHILGWVNPTTGKDQNGNTVPFDVADIGQLDIQFDDQTPNILVPYPGPPGQSGSFDLSTLAQYKSLSPGAHVLALGIITKEGVVGGLSVDVPFSIGVAPDAPSAVVVN